MCLPHIAPTWIGLRSSYELRILQEVINSKEPKALIMGGAKIQKVGDLVKIAQTGVDIFTGGLPGQVIAKSRGYDLGEANNKFLAKKFSAEDFGEAKRLDMLLEGNGDHSLRHPIDFVVDDDGVRKTVKLEDLPKTKGEIRDIGPETLETYASALQEKPLRIRAGPLGVYEQGFQNGLELTKRISGDGLIFLGGDTSQETQRGGAAGPHRGLWRQDMHQRRLVPARMGRQELPANRCPDEPPGAAGAGLLAADAREALSGLVFVRSPGGSPDTTGCKRFTPSRRLAVR